VRQNTILPYTAKAQEKFEIILSYSHTKTMKKEMGRIFILAGLTALIDQLCKFYAEKFLAEKTIGTSIFRLEYSQNTGIAFGIPVPFYLLIALTIFMMGFVIYFAISELNLKNEMSIVAISFIIGGALGNLIDRLTHGYVIDFIGIWKWPNFNVADAHIVIGILLLIVFYGKINKTKNYARRRK